jgi:hypothetical protein
MNWFDKCKTAEEVFELAKKLKIENHPDKFNDPIEKEIQEEKCLEIEEAKDKKLKELAEKEKLSFEKSLRNIKVSENTIKAKNQVIDSFGTLAKSLSGDLIDHFTEKAKNTNFNIWK